MIFYRVQFGKFSSIRYSDADQVFAGLIAANLQGYPAA